MDSLNIDSLDYDLTNYDTFNTLPTVIRFDTNTDFVLQVPSGVLMTGETNFDDNSKYMLVVHCGVCDVKKLR